MKTKIKNKILKVVFILFVSLGYSQQISTPEVINLEVLGHKKNNANNGYKDVIEVKTLQTNINVIRKNTTKGSNSIGRYDYDQYYTAAPALLDKMVKLVDISKDINSTADQFSSQTTWKKFGYPVISSDEIVSEFNYNYSNGTLNYDYITRYALLSYIAYGLEELAGTITDDDKVNYYNFSDDFWQLIEDTILKPTYTKEEIDKAKSLLTGIKLLKIAKMKKSQIIAIAVVLNSLDNPDKKQMIIAYKGTSNKADIKTDLQLVFSNMVTLGNYDADANEFFIESLYEYQNYLSQDHLQDNDRFHINNARTFYEKKEYKDALISLEKVSICDKVSFTGHSLGGYLAGITSSRYNSVARTFSSPAIYVRSFIQPNPSSRFCYPNIVNFYRHGDPVVVASGQSNQCSVEFQGVGSNLINNHPLGPFIQDILMKGLPAKFSYITPGVNPGYGIKHRSYPNWYR
jgi:hypothetical protein